MPYAFFRVMQGKEPNTVNPQGIYPKEKAEWLLQEPNMRGQYLGGCLDSCRWGSMMTVMYEMSPVQLVGFIDNWFWQNRGNDVEALFHEHPIDKVWERFELPRLKWNSCPRDPEHKGKTRDLDGTIRCADTVEYKVKPNYAESWNREDEFSQSVRRHWMNVTPPRYYYDPTSYDEDGDPVEIELDEFQKNELRLATEERNAYDAEEEISKLEHCGAILDEGNRVLSLEAIIRRLNVIDEQHRIHCNDPFGGCKREAELSGDDLKRYQDEKSYMTTPFCPGHLRQDQQTEFPFDGWTLAHYVQRWYEQDGAPLFMENPREHLGYPKPTGLIRSD